MVKLKGLECTINTADGPLEEYIDDITAYRDWQQLTATKSVYIESKDSQEFSISFRVHSLEESVGPDANAVALHFTFDDLAEPDCNIVTSLQGCRYTGFAERCSSRKKKWVLRRYSFAKLQDLKPNRRLHYLRVSPETVGEIKVSVMRYKLPGGGNNIKKYDHCRSLRLRNGKMVFHRRIIKGNETTHTIGLSSADESQKCAALRVCTGEYIDTLEQPYAVFRFLYRSRACLENLGFVHKTIEASLGFQAVDKMSLEAIQAELRMHRIVLIKDSPEYAVVIANRYLGMDPLEVMSRQQMEAEIPIHRVRVLKQNLTSMKLNYPERPVRRYEDSRSSPRQNIREYRLREAESVEAEDGEGDKPSLGEDYLLDDHEGGNYAGEEETNRQLGVDQDSDEEIFNSKD